MFKSLKLKFIVSFVVVEIIFLSIISNINFNSIDKISQNLINEKISITKQLLVELIKTPLIVYDLATLDDIVKNFATVKNVIAIRVDSPENAIFSKYIKKNTLSQNIFNKIIHTPKTLKQYNEEEYIFSIADVIVENQNIGHIHFVFSAANNMRFMNDNKRLTYLTILIALIIGLIISYMVGNYLGKSLKSLTTIANYVAEDKDVTIPYNPKSTDEIGKLFYTMHTMQKLIHQRSKKLNTSINDLEQFINAVNQSAIVSKTDTSGIITYVNERFCEVTGYTAQELIGKTHSMLRDPESDDAFYKNMWQTISSKNIFHETFKNIKKDKEEFYVDMTIVPLLDNNGAISEYIAIRHEVTEIVDAKNKAIEAKKAKEEFLSNMSHEIRTPINAILGFIKILQDNTSNEQNMSYIKIIDSSSKLLLHIINDILDLSKIESDKLTIDIHPFNPIKEIEEVVKVFSIMAQEKSINLLINTDNEIPICLDGDIIRIKQIVFNFLSNALKFTNKNKSIFVNLKYDYNKTIWSISVKDEGIGISKEAQNKIFNAFEQADNSTTREYGGTGLGLTISVKLSKLMGGNISLDSIEGKGSIFTLALPLKIHEKEHETISLISKDKDLNDKEYKGNILIAEDNHTNQMLIKLLLDGYGISYTIANDGLEATSLFKKSSFDMVLMDENMPNMTGSQALKEIRAYETKKQLSHTPIVSLTANVLKGDIDRFIAIGMDDFLAKPIDTKELERVLDKFLNN